MIDAEEKKPFMVHCGDCGHEWAAAFFPMEAMAFCNVALSHGKNCPKCSGKKVFCGIAGEGSSVSVTIQESPRQKEGPAGVRADAKE